MLFEDHHGVYGDTYCAQAQIVAAIAQSNPRAILEEDTMAKGTASLPTRVRRLTGARTTAS